MRSSPRPVPEVKVLDRKRAVAWGAVTGILLAVVLVRVTFLYEPYTFLIGDCPYYAQAAISLLTDGDLDLRNQLKGGLEIHQRQISLGARGEWYPKHPVLMSLMTIPLLPLLGMNAFLVFNVIVLLALALVLYELAREAAGAPGAAAGAVLTISGSFLILYDYNYSPDLFACLLLSWSVLAGFRSRPAASGFLAGLAVFARTSNLFLLPILLGYVAWKSRLRGAAFFIAAVTVPLLCQAALNQAMFGSPLMSPYQRIISLQDGRVVLRSHVSDFDNPILEGIRGQLLDPGKGLLFTAPILLAAIPGFVIWFRRSPDKALLCFVIGEFLFLLFSRYRWWPTSHQGNRFLMPVLSLSAPAVAASVEWGAVALGLLKPAPAAPVSASNSPAGRGLEGSSGP